MRVYLGDFDYYFWKPGNTSTQKGPGLLSLWSIGVFLTWTVTSFLCHFFAKNFLSSMRPGSSAGRPRNVSLEYLRSGAVDASLLTLFQVGVCYILIKVRSPGEQWRLVLATVAHVGATWFTNISMACMFASSTFAIKLMEPITSAVLQFVILGTPLSPLAILSLPIIVGGAIIFTGSPIAETNLSIGIAAAFASNIILGLRNVLLKMGSSKQGQTEISLKPLNREVLAFAVLSTGAGAVAWTQGYLQRRVVYLATTCTLSGIFHVLYSYVSTGVVLTHLSVVSHAVTNILKRVLVVLLLYVTGTRSASPVSFLGLAVCTLGLFTYAWSKRDTQNKVDDERKVKRDSTTTAWVATLAKLAAIIVVLLLLILGVGVLKNRPRSEEHKTTIKPPQSDTLAHHSFNPYQMDRTFSHEAHNLPAAEDLLPDMNGYLAPQADSIRQFLQEDLFREPNRSSFLSRQLLTPAEISNEAQRIHFDVMGKALGKFKYAMLLDIASFENKGDPCITVGEIYYLARTKLDIVYYCSSATSCSYPNMQKAAELAKTFSVEDLVILIHGGGNISGYAFSDIHRFFILKAFRNYKIFVFPQSIWVRYNNFEHPHFKRCIQHYCCNENVTFVMRDHLSYSIAQKYFQGDTKFILAPDMAFQIGPVRRFMSPVFDIMWIRRGDAETPGYSSIPAPPPGIRLHVSDWWKWRTPAALSSLERAHYICTNGFFYLQRGRVVITDRLHGHILATLSNIPHVLIDNKAHKLSAYHNSWTASLENTVITDDPSKAVDLAVELLHKYNSSLPPRVPFLHIDETLTKDQTFEQPELSYP
ncbi:hypothetical protein EGW08_020444 [Elysia chlorotica]|uniref:Polysaccharide pyruvyl transferase domain-containing protein n=1 Tax=Elysia chlorotica TaxID=188477 RepID=A0A3S0ZCG4_ELYCH|nr:hypothetical protein EGW08_020444 [Elysia chlorotica]